MSVKPESLSKLLYFCNKSGDYADCHYSVICIICNSDHEDTKSENTHS